MDRQVLKKLSVLCGKHRLPTVENISLLTVDVLERLFLKICKNVIVDAPNFARTSAVDLIQSMLDFIGQEMLHIDLKHINAKGIVSRDWVQLDMLVTLFQKLDRCFNFDTSTSYSTVESTSQSLKPPVLVSLAGRKKPRSVLYSPRTTVKKHPNSMKTTAVKIPSNLTSIKKPKCVKRPSLSRLEEAVFRARKCSPLVHKAKSKLVQQTADRLMNSPGLRHLLTPKQNRFELAAKRRHELLAVRQAKLVLKNAHHTNVHIKAKVAKEIEEKLLKEIKENRDKDWTKLRDDARVRDAWRQANVEARKELVQQLQTQRTDKPITVIDRIRMLER